MQLLAFDFGTKHIGVAIGQTISESSEGLTQLQADNGRPNWEEIDALVNEWRPDAFVIGLPLNMDGSQSHMSKRAKKFSNRLDDRYHIPCHLVDERLSSQEARTIVQNKTKEGISQNKKQSESVNICQLIIG